MLKRGLIMLFCLQVFAGNNFAMELTKLPFLIHHYIEHESKETPGIGFGQFLWMHYVDNHHQKAEKGHCDEELPFKHCQDCCHHVVMTLPCLLPEPANLCFPASEKTAAFVYTDRFLSFYDCCIWQPPKLG